MREETSIQLSPLGKVRLAFEILVAYGRIRWALRRDEFGSVVASLRATQNEIEALSRTGRFHLAGAVSRLLSVTPTDSRCLVRSLVLLALLERRGVSSRLVIGVRTEPEFAAHAWIECEGEALLPAGGGEFVQLTSL